MPAAKRKKKGGFSPERFKLALQIAKMRRQIADLARVVHDAKAELRRAEERHADSAKQFEALKAARAALP